jgi:hypothetical protein
MAIKKPALTYEQAINAYFGGVKHLAANKFPFKCTCGGSAYSEADIWQHIRKEHKERLKKVVKV